MMYFSPIMRSSKVASTALTRQQPKTSLVTRCFASKIRTTSSRPTEDEHCEDQINYSSDIYDQLERIQQAEELNDQKEKIERHTTTKSQESLIDDELYTLQADDIFEKVHVAFELLSEEN